MKLVTVSFCVFINLWPRPWPRPRDDWPRPRPRSLWPRPRPRCLWPRPWPHELMASLTSLPAIILSTTFIFLRLIKLLLLRLEEEEEEARIEPGADRSERR